MDKANLFVWQQRLRRLDRRMDGRVRRNPQVRELQRTQAKNRQRGFLQIIKPLPA